MANKVPQTLNVFQQPLRILSTEPMTGFYRNGYCDVGPDDPGNHSVAATLTARFLDFSASRGNDLRTIGLTPGCKWCLCAARWREALEHARTLEAQQTSSAPADLVPHVYLAATSVKALGVVSLADLEAHATEGDET